MNVGKGPALAALISAAAGYAGAAQAQSASIFDAIGNGRPILDARLRAAAIDQAGFAEDAESITLRTRLGWETDVWNGFSALLEFEDVTALVDDYNSTLNGKTQFPVEADPEGTEINRAQLSWTDGERFTLTGGRQRIILDDARFVGNVGWRQDEQTYDAVRADAALGPVAASYAYVWNVERIFAEAADFDSDSHLINLSWTASDALTATGFVYALDLSASAASTVTYGARLSGAGTAGAVRWSYEASYAMQDDYAGNPNSIDLDYWLIEGGAGTGPVTFGAGYEVLEGNGTAGFSTPLATLHAYQGWADVFLGTPASGIEDAYASLRFAPDWSAGWLGGVAFLAVYHDFSAEQGGADLGSEIDLQLTATLAERLGAVLKYADYDGPAGGPADRSKFWAGLSFSL